MKFLLVLSEREMAADIWDQTIESFIKQKGGEVETLHSSNNVQLAVGLLSDPDSKYDEVISGSFGGLDGGDWTKIRDAIPGGVRLTLLSGGFTDRKIKELKGKGVGAIDKDYFKDSFTLFLEDRFPQRSLKEIR